VTRGPAFEPIDEVRRLTNFSTGDLGGRLAQVLAEAGYRVILFSGGLTTAPDPASDRVEAHRFDTNESLAAGLQSLAGSRQVLALFHTAALCDYRVRSLKTVSGAAVGKKKIASRAGNLILELEPARKVISDLRDWYPNSRLVGWKYELEGERPAAVQRARDSIVKNRLDLGVINGAAFGGGYGLVTSDGALKREEPDKDRLCSALVEWLASSCG